MAEWLAHLPLDQKIRGSFPGSNPLCSCHCGGSYSNIQAYEVYIHRLPPCILGETLNGGPESLASVVLAVLPFDWTWLFCFIHSSRFCWNSAWTSWDIRRNLGYLIFSCTKISSTEPMLMLLILQYWITQKCHYFLY